MMGVPSTIPPFQATNAPKAASTVEYGRNDGKIWGNTLGNAAIDHSRSAAHQHGARSQLHEKGRDTRKRAPTGRCSKGGRIVKLITRVCGPCGRSSEPQIGDLARCIRIQHPHNVRLAESAANYS